MFKKFLAQITLTSLIFSSLFLGVHVKPAYSYSAAEFSTSDNGDTYALDSDTNVFIGSFILPDPAADSVTTNGSGNAVSAKDALTAFAGTNYFIDKDNDGVYSNGEGVVLSTNSNLNGTDTMITTATAALSAVETTQTDSDFIIYLDQGITASSYDNQEDIYNLQHYGTAAAIADGDVIRNFSTDIVHIDVDHNGSWSNTANCTGSCDALVDDADSDGLPSAGDTIVKTGTAHIRALLSFHSVCFDASVVADAEYDANEVIWFDVAGDCASFTSLTDIILVGAGAPAGISTEFGTEQEIGFLDVNDDGSYTCTRAGTCEPIVYSGADGTDLDTGNMDTPATMTFFDSSTEATDGIATTGIGWDESGGAHEFDVLNGEDNGSGDDVYVYVDADASTDYTLGEHILSTLSNTSYTTAVATTGNIIRFFDSNEKLYNETTSNTFSGTTTGIVLSVDTNFDAGALDGTGADTVIRGTGGGGNFTSFPATTVYYDDDTSGSYVDGDDIVDDADGSGYYNADDLQNIAVDVAGSSDDIDDTYLSAVYIYQPVGSSCAGSGTDTLLGTKASSPFLNTSITITKDPYAASDSEASRTVCVYADLANNSVHGTIWSLTIDAGDAGFATTDSSPLTDFSATSSPVQFVAPLTATVSAGNSRKGRSTTYTVTYTNDEDAIGLNEMVGVVTFPSGYDVSSAVISCTDDGAGITGTSTVSSQSVRLSNGSGGSIASGSAIVCSISSVVNPSTEGTTGAFTVRTTKSNLSRTLQIDSDETVSISSVGSTSGGSSAVYSYSVTVSAPNGGETFVAGDVEEITWYSGGSGTISYVNIYYSSDNGENYTLIAQYEDNDGAYDWTVPDVNSQEMLVLIEATDLVESLVEDASDEVFAVIGATTPEPTAPSSGTMGISPVTGELEDISVVSAGDYMRSVSLPTVYYIDSDMTRRPFISSQIYFTWSNTFDDIFWVTDATLPTFDLGAPMLPKPGVTLVKLQSDPKVYAVEEHETDSNLSVLRWISSEETAISIYGADWADYVIDIPVTLFSRFDFGEDVNFADDIEVDVSIMKRRTALLPEETRDTDSDGLTDLDEIIYGTDATNPDTDGDGFEDGVEVQNGYNPNGTGNL